MKRLFITKENLEVFIKGLKKACDEFIAPKKENLDDIIFCDTKDVNSELLEYNGNSVISPRAFLLPQTEPLMEIKNHSFSPIMDKRKRIFYGIRPCDMDAIVLMRRFFMDEFVDMPYKEKMDRSTFIVLACVDRCSSKSFCDEVGSGPVANEGFDLQLIPVKSGFLVDTGSEKGNELVKKNSRLFANITSFEAVGGFKKPAKKINYKKLAKLMKEEKIPEFVWDDIGLRCVVCSGCITLCPTCSCFSIVDRLNGGNGVRFRYCDGCPYAGFTRMAGGHTPFPQHKEHIRRFFEHKLNVDVERYGRPSCVGCGRCIETCPGNISIRKFIEGVHNEK